jgi:hypothetical protein
LFPSSLLHPFLIRSFIGFIPSKQIGVILLCSCDSDDADMNNLGFVLLNLSGIGILDKDVDSRIQSSPSSSDQYS